MGKDITAPLAETEKFTARNDYAFKKLFGTEENKDILIDFLSLAIEINKSNFEDVRIENNELSPQFYQDKTGKLDIKIVLKDKKKINIEMQNIYFSYYPKRSILYWCELFIEDFKKGDAYSNLNKCIAINILNSPFPLTNKLHSIYQILEIETHTQLDEVLEIHFFDLTKLYDKNMSELEKWLLFIRTDDKKLREKLAEENPMIAKANTVMNTFYSNEKERAAYQAAWHYESDRISMLKETEEKAMAQGIARGKKEGKKEGKKGKNYNG
ncbi:MAG: Rpn family recombination-promoting nuclease/putative transposase [Treponema sp.]